MAGTGGRSRVLSSALIAFMVAIVMMLVIGFTPHTAQASSYSDCPDGQWYSNHVQWAKDNGVMSGYSGTNRFGPFDTLTRGQAVTVIYRYFTGMTAETTDNSVDPSFTDVDSGAYDSAAVEWASTNNVVTGYTGTTLFGPNDPVTREQFAAMLHRAARASGNTVGSLRLDFSIVNSFPDTNNASQYAYMPLAWCCAEKIITGIDGKLAPADTIWRASVATMMERFEDEASYHDYDVQILNSHGLFTGCNIILWVKTANPSGDNLDILVDGKGIGQSSVIFNDIKTTDEGNVIPIWHKLASGSGYVTSIIVDDEGSHTIQVAESNFIGAGIGWEYCPSGKKITVNVNDYDTAMYAWMDKIISEQTTSSMTPFEKMDAVCDYLCCHSDHDLFKYPANMDGKQLNLISESGPFFTTLRWNSYVSPYALCKFAEHIGGFDDIHDCYGDYPYSDPKWASTHYLAKLTIGSDVRYFEACPFASTNTITEIDYLDI